MNINIDIPFVLIIIHYLSKGVGLGLTICKRLVGIIGPKEEIIIESEINVGSKFSYLVYIDITL